MMIFFMKTQFLLHKNMYWISIRKITQKIQIFLVWKFKLNIEYWMNLIFFRKHDLVLEIVEFLNYIMRFGNCHKDKKKWRKTFLIACLWYEMGLIFCSLDINRYSSLNFSALISKLDGLMSTWKEFLVWCQHAMIIRGASELS